MDFERISLRERVALIFRVGEFNVKEADAIFKWITKEEENVPAENGRSPSLPRIYEMTTDRKKTKKAKKGKRKRKYTKKSKYWAKKK